MARLERARALGSRGRSAVASMGQWARDYDADVFGRLKVTGTRRIAELLAGHLPPGGGAAAIIDLGCGTGAAGVVLKEHGCTIIDGLDLVAGDAGPRRGPPAPTGCCSPPTCWRRCRCATACMTPPSRPAPSRPAMSAPRRCRPFIGSSGRVEFWPASLAGRSWSAGGFAEAISRLVGAGRLTILHHTVEPIRDGGPPEGHMLVMQIG